MAETKTKPTDVSVDDFIEGLADDATRAECRTLIELMSRVTGEKPRMWGPGMIGFGTYSYTYPSGHSGEWYVTGFAPRKANLSITIMSGFPQHDDLMARLGKFKTGKSCLYVKKLGDIDIDVLEELVTRSVTYVHETYP